MLAKNPQFYGLMRSKCSLHLNAFACLALLFWAAIFLQSQAQTTIQGSIVDAKSGKSVPFASVALNKLGDSKLQGTMADSAGQFQLDFRGKGRFVVQISAIGYQKLSDTLDANQIPGFLSKVSLSSSAAKLDAFELEEERALMELGVDRKIFNVEKSVLATGGSALDALRQVPLVQVDVDGNISVRGSDQLIVYINGKPSGLTVDNRSQILAQIPAASIVRIELITSPSARYDAEGMAGIINVITRTNREDGSFGQISLGGGWPANSNISGNWNLKKGKWNLSTNLGARQSLRPVEGYTLRETFVPGTDRFTQDQDFEGERWDIGVNLSGNVEYSPDERNSISLNYLAGPRWENNPETLNSEFRDSTDSPYRGYLREIESTEDGWNADASLNWTNKGKVKGSEWNSSLSASYYSDLDAGTFNQTDYDPTGLPLTQTSEISRTQRFRGSQVYTAQIDRVQMLGSTWLRKLEFGLRGNFRRIDSDLDADSLDIATDQWFRDTLLTAAFRYDEYVSAAYLQFAGGIGKRFEFQVGLRSEHTIAQGFLDGNQQAFDKRYINFFPTTNLKFTAGKSTELSFGYARRINRPGFWSLNPFPDYSDPFNIRRGNPDLDPELTDAFELGLSKSIKSHYIYGAGFFRYTNNPMQRLISVDTNGVALVERANFGFETSFGFEGVYRAQVGKKLSGTFSLNLFRNYVDGGTENGDLTATNFSANIRSQAAYRPNKNWEIQGNVFYQAPQQFPQGSISEFFWVDLGFRKEFPKAKFSLAVNASDIFNTRRFRFESQDETFRGDILRDPMTLRFTVQATWKFGDPGKMKPERRRGGGGGGGYDDMGM